MSYASMLFTVNELYFYIIYVYELYLIFDILYTKKIILM